MSIFTTNEKARQAHSSPTIALEKGAFRMRATRKPSALGRTANTRPSQGHYRGASTVSVSGLPEKQMAVIVVLLVIAVVSCFSVAYYLFVTRYVLLDIRMCRWSPDLTILSPRVR